MAGRKLTRNFAKALNEAFASRKDVRKTDAAAAAEVTTAHIANLLSGKSTPSEPIIVKIASRFGGDERRKLLDALARDWAPKYMWEELAALRRAADGGPLNAISDADRDLLDALHSLPVALRTSLEGAIRAAAAGRKADGGTHAAAS